MCEEMTKLRAELDRLGIKWSDKSGENITRTHFWVNNYLISVIHGKGTYGGVNVLNGKDDGFLEMLIGNIDPKGWLTASDVIEKVEDLNGEVITKEQREILDGTHKLYKEVSE